ncbi:DoxX family protein [Xanthobacter dioxanivorans]|uniref:DoxX family protein n=1 Tax=Xanthobacter dioxanivorans TaxID=2528964 RepID=A0A974PMM4_9HYPH|nr:DoxX family protein [Xanthobacter dioxanivorans]QRG06359.1 DoxX family protein [Xanthobacter dioxanivorans]
MDLLATRQGLRGVARRLLSPAPVRFLALLALCGAYLQGGINKAMDFPSAMAEMGHFGLAPAAPFAVAVIALELGASAMILAGFGRWLGALGLAGFTLMASLLANRFWEMAMPERFFAANAFFEHLGLAGAFVLVAWYDLAHRA